MNKLRNDIENDPEPWGEVAGGGIVLLVGLVIAALYLIL